MFFEHFKAICTERNTTPTAVVRSLGLSTGKVTAWKNGSIPKSETLSRLAGFLNVPIYAFFGGETQVSNPTPNLPDDALELVEIYQRLSKPDQRRLFGKAYELLDAQSSPRTGEELTPPNIDMVATVMDSRIKK